MKVYLLKSKIVLFVCLVPVLLMTGPGYAGAEEPSTYPSRPITAIHPYAAGVTADLALRLISKEAEKYLGQPVIVMNKPGAGGAIGTAAIASSKPDGYTIGNCQPSPMFLIPFLSKVPYHPLKDFKLIIQYASFNMGLLVKADSPLKSFGDLVDYARKNPKKATIGLSPDSIQYFILEQVAKKEKVQFTYMPFKGGAETQTAALGGHIVAAACDFNASLVESGQLRLLALFREETAEEYPDVPIMKQLGYDFPMPMPQTLGCPKGVPDEIVKKLEDAYTKAMKSPAFIKGMKELRIPIHYRGSKELTDYVTYNYNYFEKLLKEMGVAK